MTDARRSPGPGRAIADALRRSRSATGPAAFWMVVGGAPAFVHGYAVAHALDEGFLAGNLGLGLAWLGALALAILVGSVGSARSMLAVGTVVESFRDRLVADVVEDTLRRSTTAGLREDASGVARLTQQVETVRLAMAGTLLVVGGFVVSVVVTVLGISALSPDVLVFVLPPVLVSLAVFAAALPALARRERTLVLAGERVAADLHALAGGLRDVRAGGADAHVRAGLEAGIEAQASAARAVAGMTALRILLVGVGGRLPVVLILLAAPWLVRNGASPGEVAGSLTYVLGTIAPAVRALADGAGAHGLPLWVTLCRLLETTTQEPDPGPAAESPAAGPRRVGPAAELRGLRFAYSEHAEPVLAGLDLTISPRERLAVVGPSGIGKSTLVGLLCGMLAPDAGQVRVAGVEVRALDEAARAGLRVLLPQEAYVFSGTLRENLLYLRPDATPTELAVALVAVGCEELCDRLGGYDARLDPASLSAGERQLIALTRAYLSPARLAVLDEATCHLDPVAEARAEEAFGARGGALVVVAHRISSARRADRILVLDGTDGLAGTHAELLAASPLYRDLVGQWDEGAVA